MRHLVAGVLFPLVGLERGVDGKALRWQVDDESSSWTPATKTVSGVHSETMMEIEMVPTPGPEVGGTKMLGELRMRQLAGSDQICGFVGGDIDQALGCRMGSYCAAIESQSAVGCCDVALADCTIATACLAQKDLGTTVVPDTDLITTCSDPLGLSTECLTLTYTGGQLDGFKGYACWTKAAVLTIQETPNRSGGRPTRGSGGGSSLSFPSQAPLKPAAGTEGASGSSSTPGAPAAEKDNDGSKDGGGGGGESSGTSNAGAIAGGAVGGLAVLSILGIGAYFLFLKKKRQDERFSKVEILYPQSPGGDIHERDGN